jgi:hypothetical protein
MSGKDPAEDDGKPARRAPKSAGEKSEEPPVGIVGRAVSEVALGAAGRVYTLLAAALLAFSSIFLMIAWYYGPEAWVRAHEYKKLTSHVDATIVDSWLALEFDAKEVTNPEFWRASTQASPCVVAEYGGDWGAPMRRAFCGTRVPFNDSYSLADMNDISEGVPFVWPRDEHGFVVPEIRVAASTLQWLTAHPAHNFMHQKWPAKTELDWLRLQYDLPDDAAVNGWTAPSPVLPLVYDPARPAESLPAGIVARRLDQSAFWPAMLLGFGVGLFTWFKGMSVLPLISGMAPTGRWIVSALPLLTLPWWLDGFPKALSFFSHDTASLVGEAFADIDRTDHLVAMDPAQAILVNGERITWRLGNSVYADTFGRYKFAPPAAPLPSKPAARAALADIVTVQTRALDDGKRLELFTNLERDKLADLMSVRGVFKPTAEEAATDAAASAATRRMASRFLTQWE